MPGNDDLINLRDSYSTKIERPLSASAVRHWDGEFDAVVVGYGIAGASAALEAAERGLDVLLIDRFQGGGASQMSGGIVYAGGGTPVQKACGVEDSPEAMADYLRREVGGLVSDETVRRFADESVDTLAFLSRHGAHFGGPRAPKKTSYPTADYFLYFSDNATVPAFKGVHPPAERGHRTMDPTRVPGARPLPGKKPFGGFTDGADMGWYLMAAIKQSVAEHPRIKVMTQTRVHRLIRDDAGGIVGVVAKELPPGSTVSHLHQWAERKATKLTLQVMGLAKPFVRALVMIEEFGGARTFRAKQGVVLAAGGYIRNTAIMARYAAPYLKTMPIGGYGDDGAGVRLGVSVGGAVGNLDKISAWRFINPPFDWTKGVIIGASGDRITNEEQYGAHLTRAIYEKSDGRAWLILDQAIWDAAFDEIANGNLYPFQQMPVKMAQKAAPRAETIEALAKKLGVSPKAMSAAVAAYSEAARSGAPDPMGKGEACRTPFGAGPYYAISLTHSMPTSPITSISTGGLRVDEGTGAVLDQAGTAVPGLYAAGRTAVGIPSNNYVSGLALADGTWSGRRAAKALSGQNTQADRGASLASASG